MKENRCIICGEKKDGLEVKEDYVIGVLRWIKRNVTKGFWPEKGAHLVVCKGCFPKYHKYRAAYSRRAVLYTALGVMFLIVLVVISPIRLLGLAYGLALLAITYLLSLLTYMPALKMPKGNTAK
jgi:hypothetical protein